MTKVKGVFRDIKSVMESIERNFAEHRGYMESTYGFINKYAAASTVDESSEVLFFDPNQWAIGIIMYLIQLCDQNMQFFTERRAGAQMLVNELNKNNPEEGEEMKTTKECIEVIDGIIQSVIDLHESECGYLIDVKDAAYDTFKSYAKGSFSDADVREGAKEAALGVMEICRGTEQFFKAHVDSLQAIVDHLNENNPEEGDE